MIIIDRTIVSDDLLDKKFMCALDRCKGACCVAGDSGAPLDWNETTIIEEVYDQVKQYMTPEGIESTETYGRWIVDSDGDFVTPLIEGVKQCAYVFFEKGIAKCAFEKAFNEGKIAWKKPISCHLYPVRITSYENYDAVNYDQWEICSPACSHGKAMGISVFEFVKDGLIRKYGINWYRQLEGSAAFKQQKSVDY